eukprot:PITA_04272
MEEFYRVNLRARYTEDTTERTTRYVNGLRLDILDEINILSSNNTKEVYQSAMKAEEKITRKQNAWRGRGANRGKGQSYGRGQTANINEEGSSSKASGSAAEVIAREAVGHPSEAGETTEVEGLVISVIGVINGDIDCLNVQKKIKLDIGVRMWRSQRKQRHLPKKQRMLQRQGKLWCYTSTDNLVSTEMVEKLELKRLKHPNPYRVSWLQKGHRLLVDEQSEVEFQIGRYKDKVVCDIMPMDVSHILLGRPWQYGRKVVHDGLTNCYKFVKDGIKHMLVPIMEEGTTETSEPRTLLVSGKQFLKQVEDSEIGYAIVKKARTILLHTEVSDLPTEIQQMLQEFMNIVVDDLLDKLPPK